MSMENRKRTGGSSNFGSLPHCSLSFLRQPARVLIIEKLLPYWSETSKVICDALDNFLSLACSLDGPTRIPMLSLFTISRQQECLLPFVHLRGNLARLRSCVEELRSISGDGCLRGAARGGELLQQAVLDSLQQFKQYMQHSSSTKQTRNSNIFLEVTIVTSQPGRHLVRQLEMGLKDADLMSLKRLLVVQICHAGDWGQDSPSPEAQDAESEDSLMLGTEVDLQKVENNVFAMEMMLKAWLQEQGGDQEHLHLLLPSPMDNPTPVCVKCDMQERLISPVLTPLHPTLGVKTESVSDFLPVTKGSANQIQAPHRLRAIKTLRADGVCESVLYGLPLLIQPTTCWKLDWDEMESNHNLFQALCSSLKSRDVFLLLQVDPPLRLAAEASGVCSHYILQPSVCLSLLLKPVVSRELLLPCPLPAAPKDPAPDALHTVQSCLSQLDEEVLLNPLSLSCNLYEHLRSRVPLSGPQYPYRSQPSVALRDQPQPLEGPKVTHSRLPLQQMAALRFHGVQDKVDEQTPSQGRQLGPGGSSKVRATVAPFPSSSSFSSSIHPPAAKVPCVTPALPGSGRGGGPRQPLGRSRAAAAAARHHDW